MIAMGRREVLAGGAALLAQRLRAEELAPGRVDGLARGNLTRNASSVKRRIPRGEDNRQSRANMAQSRARVLGDDGDGACEFSGDDFYLGGVPESTLHAPCS
jgi:hypothetical protein